MIEDADLMTEDQEMVANTVLAQLADECVAVTEACFIPETGKLSVYVDSDTRLAFYTLDLETALVTIGCGREFDLRAYDNMANYLDTANFEVTIFN